jgi:hypothetical protein
MNRPIYEDHDDRAAEKLLVEFLVNVNRWSGFERTPKMYPCDWVIDLGGGDFGLLELKWREKFYSQYLISLHKVATLITYAEIGNFVPMLGVGWKDIREVALWEPIRREYLKPGFGGRRDRGDHQDVEPVVYADVRCARRQAFF